MRETLPSHVTSFWVWDHMKRYIMLAAAVAIGTLGSAVNAATLVKEYHATSAYNDAYGRFGSGHSAHLPGTTGGSDFDFETPGIFRVYSDGSATLTGTVFSDTLGSTYAYDVSVKFQAATTYTPKKELRSAAYVGNGGPVDPSSWSFFNMVAGSLTGLGNLAGTTLSLFEAPVTGKHPFQVGFGANGKNVGFGGSGWFLHSAIAGVDCTQTPSACLKGDFNIDLVAAPVPAAGLLFPAALGALGFASRRRRKSAA